MTQTPVPPSEPATDASGDRQIRFAFHPDRAILSQEMHARPPLPLKAPMAITHIAMVTGEGGYAQDREHLADLVERLDVVPPPQGAKHHVFELGPDRLTWERHTEFTTYAMVRALGDGALFSQNALAALPGDWLSGLPGRLIAGTHIVLLAADGSGAPQGETDLARLFASDRYMGSHVLGGLATIYTDMRLHADGFGRVVILDKGLPDYQAGRIVKWVQEIETYRMMALLAFTLTRAVQPRIAELEHRLSDLAEALAGDAGEEDKETLAQLMRISGEVEKLSTETRFRFAASRAYRQLVRSRIEFLNGAPVHGLQSIGNFIENRLAPAMDTMEAAAGRIDTLAGAVARALGVLRTKVDIVLEDQNRALLSSMERRVRQQVLLTQAVEGLSVAAISYYVTGLVGWGAKALKSAGLLPIAPDLVAGIALPLVVLGTWQLVRRRRSLIEKI